MLRPPTSGGRGESDFQEYDDVEIEPKRGKVEDVRDQHPDSRPADSSTGESATGERPTAGQDPAEGRSDLGFPGADRDSDLPERLGERLENGSSSSIAPGEPDVLPDVEPPETTM
jgi:hypothetical protein